MNIFTPHSSLVSAAQSSSPELITVVSSQVSANPLNYRYSIHYLRGSGHHGKWSLGFYKLDNGNGRILDIFNSTSQISAQLQLNRYTQASDQEFPWNFTVDPKIVFTSNTISEELSGVASFQYAAHPALTISTVVIDTRNAHQLTLSDIFIDENQGLHALSVLVTEKFTQKYHDAPDPSGVAPKEENFQHWVPIHEGFRIIFEDYQMGGHGISSVIIPWSKLEQYLKPEMRNLGK